MEHEYIQLDLWEHTHLYHGPLTLWRSAGGRHFVVRYCSCGLFAYAH